MVLVTTGILVGGAELGARLSGWGYPTSFLVEDEIGGRPVWRSNEFYGYRFFQPLMARSPAPIAIAREKPAGVKRVAVLGESAAMGDPLIEFSLARALDKILNKPGEPRRYEVVNAGVTAISSAVIVDIAEELSAKDFDIFVLYMGNNEAVGPYGPDQKGPLDLDVFPAKRPEDGGFSGRRLLGKWFAPLHVWWTRTRFASAVSAWQSSASPGRPWDGIAMFSENRLSPGSAQVGEVHAAYERNLERIVNLAQKRGIETILCTVAVNLSDCPPFGSTQGRVLADEEAAEWQRSLEAGGASLDAGRYTEAAQAFAEALRIDPDHAEANYLAAVAAEQSGDPGGAVRLYRQARDLDTLRVRTDNRMNESIRAVAARRGTKLIESDKVFGPAPGAASFVDHVHFTFEGAGLLANAVAAAIDGSSSALDTDALAGRLDYNSWSKRKLAAIMLQRLENPPFRDQDGNSSRIARWQTSRQSEEGALSAADPEQILDDLQKREAEYPWDEEYAIQSLHRLAGIGAWPEAAALADRIRPRLRGASAVNGLLALAWAKTGRSADAVDVLVSAGPPYGFFLIDAVFQLLGTLTDMGETSAAREVADQILTRAPDFPGRAALVRWHAENGAGP